MLQTATKSQPGPAHYLGAKWRGAVAKHQALLLLLCSFLLRLNNLLEILNRHSDVSSVNLPIIATPKSSHIIANTELLKIGGRGGSLSMLKRRAEHVLRFGKFTCQKLLRLAPIGG